MAVANLWFLSVQRRLRSASKKSLVCYQSTAMQRVPNEAAPDGAVAIVRSMKSTRRVPPSIRQRMERDMNEHSSCNLRIP